MAMKKITYFVDGKKKELEVKLCDTLLKKFAGLIFRRNSPPLLFVFNKEKKFSIHSIFCKPFTAIWLDDKMHATKITKVKNWKTNISGRGKYLLETQELPKKDESSTGKYEIYNRNI